MKPAALSRRRFLSTSAQISAVATAAPYVISSGVLAAGNRPGPNDKIRLGFIGVGPQAMWHVTVFRDQPDVAITAICDVWKERLNAAVDACKEKHQPRRYHDFRELLADPNVDAVVIAPPPHWHTLIAVAACEAGKDFYLEKPMTLAVDESKALRNAVQKHEIVSQIGTQIHASPVYHQAVGIVRSGRLGKISHVRTMMVMNQTSQGIGSGPDADPPAGLDWDMWCGPSPMRAYNPLITTGAFNHSSFMAYSGGWTPGMAPHIIDLPYWALELDAPLITASTGGRFLLKDIGDCPDTVETIWQFPDLTMTWSMCLVNSYGFEFQRENKIARRNASYFHGENGTMQVADYATLRISPEGDRMPPAPATQKVVPDSPGHQREWLDCVKSRQQPSCHVGYHHKLNLASALSNLSLKLGRSIKFDPKTQSVTGDEEAQRLCRPEYRAPWKFPASYV